MLQSSVCSGDAPDIDSLRLPPKRGGPMFSEYFGSVPLSVSLRNMYIEEVNMVATSLCKNGGGHVF